MPLEKVPRGPSAPLAYQISADMAGTEAGALSGEHQWRLNGMVSRDDIVGHRIPASCSSRPSVAPVVLVLISLATLTLMLSSISLTLTCVAVTTSSWQRRAGAAEELALYKEQTKNHSSENRRNEGSAHKAHEKDTNTSAKIPLPSLTRFGRRLSDSRAAASATQSVPCQCAEVSQVESGPPVTAHVSGAETDAGSPIKDWQAKDCTSDRILCQDGRLAAFDGGLYSVYSQLYILLYLGEEEERTMDRFYSFWHSVFRSIPADEKSMRKEVEAEALMERRWTVTGRSDPVEVTSHLAGVFNLSSNDELTVRWSTSRESHVHCEQKTTYFGMFKIK